MSAPNNRICQLEECDRKHHAKGYCQKHDRQIRDHGHILTAEEISDHMRANRAKRTTWRGWAKEQTDHLERANFQYRCKQKVFARDNYTCQVCFSGSEYLQVDHIKSWREHPELRFDMDNLRAVCMPCHYYLTYKKKLPKGRLWGHTRRII
jgi:5-methylcytosine-specific restriction endonuclease McrA